MRNPCLALGATMEDINLFRANRLSISIICVSLPSNQGMLSTNAQVAELVDALVSGTSKRKFVQVRFLSWAPSSVSDHNAQVAELVDALL